MECILNVVVLYFDKCLLGMEDIYHWWYSENNQAYTFLENIDFDWWQLLMQLSFQVDTVHM